MYDQITPDEMPRTLMQAVRYFADPDVCDRYMRSIKWPDGKITCPACGSERIGEVKTRRLMKCRDCERQISLRDGTIFAASLLPIGHWLSAVWCVANGDSVSSYMLAEALDLRQPSALKLLTYSREAIHLAH